MRIVLLLVGGYMLGAGLGLLAKPGAMKQIAESAMAGPKRYIWALVAAVFGAGMLWAAPVSRTPLFIQVLGGWALLKGALILALPATAQSRFIGWWLGLPQAVHRVWALAAVAIGLTVMASV